jgi:glycosyltransferase involved in cell wall biosynthesis
MECGTNLMHRPLDVVCVCGGYGFPHGHASTMRIRLVGRALLQAGVGFHVLHCGPSPVPDNTEAAGRHEGISFEYTTGTVRRPRRRGLRLLKYLCGFLRLVRRLNRRRRDPTPFCVYLFVQGDLLAMTVALFCLLRKIPVIQEINEWWPGTPGCSRLTAWFYAGPFLGWARGVIAITPAIERRLRDRFKGVARAPRVLVVPILVDAHDARSAAPATPPDPSFFLWCGLLDDYLRDVLFLVRAFALCRRRQAGAERLVLAGAHTDATRERVRFEVRRQQLAETDVVLPGFVPRGDLLRLQASAVALLLPLWEDDRSATRMPTKLGEYLASGRPVVTSRVGEAERILSDRRTALLAPAGQEPAFAACMALAASEPQTARDIGANGRALALREFDYRVHATRLAEFARACAGSDATAPALGAHMNRTEEPANIARE